MKKEGGEKDIVGDSENDVRDNFKLEIGIHPTMSSQLRAEPCSLSVNLVPTEVEKFKALTENVLKKQNGSTSLAIDINASGTSSTKNDLWIQNQISTVPEMQCGSTSHAIHIDKSSASLTKNDNSILNDDEGPFDDGDFERPTVLDLPKKKKKAKCPAITGKVTENGPMYRPMYTFDDRWIKNRLEGDNSTLVGELESYVLSHKKPEKKILRVPTIFGSSKSCYWPKIVAIGPYHHHKLGLQMRPLKIQFILQYAKQSGKPIKTLYEEMEKLLIDAKNYYAEDIIECFDDKKFVDMMFLDSCFVIQFMDICVKSKENNIRAMYIETSLIMRDIMLLENQLPFEILTKLMSLSLRFEGDKGEKMVDKFIKLIMNDPPIEEEAPRRKTCFWFCRENSKPKETRKDEKKPIHLLELVQTKFVDDKEIKDGIEDGAMETPSSNWCSYRSAKELTSVGIHFEASKSRRFSDITFDPTILHGRLRLPRITIEDNTKSLLLNLVAFEARTGTLSNFGVSSYVYFMDTLIDYAEDVKELRSEGIIFNLLGSDKQVAILFNEISENLVFDIRVFGNVKKSLNAFYRSSPRLWLTEFLHDHFRSPWAIIAFFAAIVVLGLTITQTVFSAIKD